MCDKISKMWMELVGAGNEEMTRAIVITCFGDRSENLLSLYRNIKEYSSLPIYIYCDKKYPGYEKLEASFKLVEPKWENNERWGVRNSNYAKALAGLELDFDSLLILDDDMRILSSGFKDGFVLAERFGMCLPLNPRIYIKHNAYNIVDVDQKDIEEIEKLPLFAPACNLSPLYVSSRNKNCVELLKVFMKELENKVCRGTLAIWKAIWKTGITPLYLPEQWCVCGSNAHHLKNYTNATVGRISPIFAHWGHPKVQKEFGLLEGEEK